MRHRREVARCRPNKPGQVVLLLSLLMIGAELLCTWCFSPSRFAEARYFPTRSDETSTRVLKDLIRNIVAQSKRNGLVPQQQEMDTLYAYQLQQQQQQPPQHYQSLMGAADLVSNQADSRRQQRQVAGGLERRAGEMAVDSSNDNDMLGPYLVPDSVPRLNPKPLVD